MKSFRRIKFACWHIRKVIMQNIDRLYRFVSISRRRVLIILVVLSGSFYAFNYAVLSENLIFKVHLKTTSATTNLQNLKSHFNNNNVTNTPYESYNIFSTTTEQENLYQQSQISQTTLKVSQLDNIASTFVVSSSTTTTDRINETEIYTSVDEDYLFNEDFFNENPIVNRTELINNVHIFSCKNITVRRAQKRNKNLIVYENFIPAEINLKCYQSITYTTHGDYRYLNNLIPLVKRWNGPISVAVYSPGSDLRPTLRVISYLRDCTSPKISELVTFHLFFEVKYSEGPVKSELQFPWLDDLYEKERWTDCSVKPNIINDNSTFRIRKRLLYPVNIARNIARSAAITHFVLASDIELYPSINLIPAFFKMLKEEKTKEGISSTRSSITAPRRVFVLPIFEVKRGLKPPKVKAELVTLLNKKEAIPFHNFICRECHLVPKYDEWKRVLTNLSQLYIFHTAKRKPPFQFWEPIYIGTKYEPPYDERLSWEGLRDKMTQGYILCALDYDFLVLDNAFLVHKPGIKRLSHRITKTVLRQHRLIDLKIKAELFKRFGKQSGCVL